MKKNAMVDLLISGGALIAGAFAAAKLNGVNIPMVPEKVKPWLSPAIGVGIAAKVKSPIAKCFGAGMVAYGGIKAVSTAFPSLGIAAIEIEGDDALMGYSLSGQEDAVYLNGADDNMGNYSLSGSDSAGGSNYQEYFV